MSYNPVTDFLGLIRQAAGGAAVEQMPGLDYVVAAMARAGLFSLFVGQTAPIVNQPSTVWLKPAQPSYTAEGTLYLWDATVGAYIIATSALWTKLFTGAAGYAFQSVTGASGAVNVGTSLLAIQRAGPAATAILLPNLDGQWNTGRALQLVDFSTAVVLHTVTLTTSDGSTIMQRSAWQLQSTADQLTGITLNPCPDLNAWVIAP